MIDPKIVENLKKYKKHQECTCLECGYQGMMGVDKFILSAFIRIPLKFSFFVIMMIVYALAKKSILALIGFVFISFPLWGKLDKRYLFCPNCQKMLKEG